MHDSYQLMTIEDIQKDEASILEVLSAIMEGRLSNNLKLLNYYNEVPVSFGATVDYIDRGMVEMTVHQTQSAAMQLQKMTFIRSDHFPHDVVAKVQRIKSEKNLAFITQFSYAQIRSDRREFVRVKVVEPLEALFQCGNTTVRGTLFDISLGGAALLAPGNTSLEEGAQGTVCLWLPDTKLELPGKLLKVVAAGNEQKYVIELVTNVKSEGIISQFIFRRQSEIIRELKDLSP